MGEVIGALLPYAVGVAISPVPLIAVILTLLGPRARTSSLGFLVGWVIGILIGFTVLSLLSGLLPEAGDTGPRPVIGVIQVALGLLLVWISARQWQQRPHRGDVPELPGWMQKIDSYGFGRSLRLGLALAVANPKNLTLTASASVVVGSAELGGTAAAVAVGVFTVLGASTVIIPVLGMQIAGDRLASPLASLRAWLTRENHVIMAVLFLILGVNAIGSGIGSIWP